MKHHDRPWKCSIEDCVYADGGFLSRKMRDDHYRHHIIIGPPRIPHAGKLDPDEVQPLLFDLVRAGKVEVIRNLLGHFNALPRQVQSAIRECAGAFGSAAVIDLIEPAGKYLYPIDSLLSSIRAANIDLFRHLLLRSKDSEAAGKHYSQIINEVLHSDSEKVFEVLVSHIESDLNIDSHPKDSRDSVARALDEQVTAVSTLRPTAERPDREALLIIIWEKTGVPKSSGRTLSTAVANVASSTCSVRLAKYLIGHGAEVNSKRSKWRLTALQCAARQDSAAAAEMMKYLLLQGADPELKPERARLSIRDEKGAKGIAKWLGMSWDELVAKTKEEREKIASKSIESVGH